MIELTAEQQQALDAEQETPKVVDPRSKTAYILVHADVYERVKELLEDAEDKVLQKAWLEKATQTRRRCVQENPY